MANAIEVTLSLVGGLAFGQALTAIKDDVLNFDTAMTNSLSIVEGVTPKLRTQFEAIATTVSKDLNYSAAQAADGLYFLASAGKSTEQVIAELPAVARFARAGMLDLADASDYTAQIQSAMGLKSKDLATDLAGVVRVQDALTQGSIISNATIGDLADSLVAKGASAANRFGLSIEEVTGLLAVFADQGLKGRRAGEAVDIVLREMARGATENADVWNSLGVSVFDAQGKFAGMPAILGALETALAGATDQQRFLTLTSLGFTAESTAYVTQLIGRSDALRASTAAVEAAGGATEKVANNQMKSLENRLGQVKQEALAFARDALPKVIDGVEQLGRMFQPAGEALLRFAMGAKDALAPIARLDLTAGIGALQAFAKVLEVVAGFLADHTSLVTLLGAAITANLAGRVLIGAQSALMGLAKSMSSVATSGQALTGGLGLLGLAITAGITAYELWGQRGEKTRQNVDDLTKALADQTKTVNENVTAWLTADIGDGGRNKSLLKFGDIDTVSKAAQGDPAAVDKLSTAIKTAHDEMMSSAPAYEAAQYSGLAANVTLAEKAFTELTHTVAASTDAQIANALTSGTISKEAFKNVRARMDASGAILTQTQYLQALTDEEKRLADANAKSTGTYEIMLGIVPDLTNELGQLADGFKAPAESAEDAQKRIDAALKKLDATFNAFIGGPMATFKAQLDFGDSVESFVTLAKDAKTTKEQLDESTIGMVQSLYGVVKAMQDAGKSPEEAQAAWKFGLGQILSVTGTTADQLNEELGGLDLTGFGYQLGADIFRGISQGVGGPEANQAGIDIANQMYALEATARAAIDAHSPSGVFAEHVGRPIMQGIADGIAGEAGATGLVLEGALDELRARMEGLATVPWAFRTQVEDARQFSAYIAQGVDAIRNSPTGDRALASAGVGAADQDAQIEAYNRAVDSMASTYAKLAAATDSATADMLVAQGLAADEFDRAASSIIASVEAEKRAQAEAAQEQRRVEDVQYQIGQMGKARYEQLLHQRLASLKVYSSEWVSTWQELARLQQEAQDKAAAALAEYHTWEDNAYKIGAMSRDDYLALLWSRLGGLKIYSDEWTSIWTQITGLEKDQLDDQNTALKKAADDQQAAADKIAAAFDSVADPIRKAGDLVGAFSGQLSVSSGTITAYMAHQVEAAKRWAQALVDLQGLGLNQATLSNLAQQGPGSLGFATGLIGLGASGIAGVNAQVGQIGAIAGQAGGWYAQPGGAGGVTVAPGAVTVNISGADATVTAQFVQSVINTAFGTLATQITVGVGG